jgi:hypothetical protein
MTKLHFLPCFRHPAPILSFRYFSSSSKVTTGQISKNPGYCFFPSSKTFSNTPLEIDTGGFFEKPEHPATRSRLGDLAREWSQLI